MHGETYSKIRRICVHYFTPTPREVGCYRKGGGGFKGTLVTMICLNCLRGIFAQEDDSRILLGDTIFLGNTPAYRILAPGPWTSLIRLQSKPVHSLIISCDWKHRKKKNMLLKCISIYHVDSYNFKCNFTINYNLMNDWNGLSLNMFHDPGGQVVNFLKYKIGILNTYRVVRKIGIHCHFCLIE